MKRKYWSAAYWKHESRLKRLSGESICQFSTFMCILKKRFQRLHTSFSHFRLGVYVGNRQTLMSFCSTVTWIIESIISLVMFVECYDQCMNTGLIASLFLPQWHYRPPFACSLLRLCVAALSVNSFCGSREALYGVFDGDRNVEVPYLLQCTMNDVLAEELHKTKSEEDYMTNTFLVMQRYTISYVSFSVNYLLTTSVYY